MLWHKNRETNPDQLNKERVVELTNLIGQIVGKSAVALAPEFVRVASIPSQGALETPVCAARVRYFHDPETEFRVPMRGKRPVIIGHEKLLVLDGMDSPDMSSVHIQFLRSAQNTGRVSIIRLSTTHKGGLCITYTVGEGHRGEGYEYIAYDSWPKMRGVISFHPAGEGVREIGIDVASAMRRDANALLKRIEKQIQDATNSPKR